MRKTHLKSNGTEDKLELPDFNKEVNQIEMSPWLLTFARFDRITIIAESVLIYGDSSQSRDFYLFCLKYFRGKMQMNRASGNDVSCWQFQIKQLNWKSNTRTVPIWQKTTVFLSSSNEFDAELTGFWYNRNSKNKYRPRKIFLSEFHYEFKENNLTNSIWQRFCI